MKSEDLEKLKALQEKLYREDKARKHQEDLVAGTFRLAASLFTASEMITYYGEHTIELKRQQMEVQKRVQLGRQDLNRKEKRDLEKAFEKKAKEMRQRNKVLNNEMLKLAKIFENDGTLNKVMDTVIEKTSAFYNEEITYEKVKHELNS